MKIIISPAKKMKINNTFLESRRMPIFLKEAGFLVERLKSLDYLSLKKVLLANDKISSENYELYQKMNLKTNLSPAILCFDGIQYTSMGANVFTEEQYEYLDQHLYILSGLYGVVKALDGICPYRLEMQAKLLDEKKKGLYEFWSDKIYQTIFKESEPVLNLCSAEYKKNIYRYLKKEDSLVDVFFYEFDGINYIEKAVYVKQARGTMVRFLAENRINDIEDVKQFNLLGYFYDDVLSSENKLVFVRKENLNINSSRS